MKKDTSLSAVFKPVVVFIKRFHTILFFLVVSGGLFTAILILLSIVNLSASTAPTSNNAVSGSFDEQTIQMIEKDTNNPGAEPKGRLSPFVE